MPDVLPDIRVVVDFGTTSTGAKWNRPTIPQDPKQYICDWPEDDTGLEIKVPSVLAKRADATGALKWGFACEKDMDETNKWRYLKVSLDPEHHKKSKEYGWPHAPPTLLDVHQLVGTYLNRIYLHIKKTISNQLKADGKEWHERSVEFVFSVPTTWTNPGILRSFQNIIRSAGYGVPKRHTAILGTTEAEAAGASFFIHPDPTWGLRKGDILLSIDAGGGTTDCGALRIVATKPPLAEQIQDARGIGIGSMLIDVAFRGLVEDKLKRQCELPPQLADNLPLLLSQNITFHIAKCRFGPQGIDGPVLEIPLRGTDANFQFREVGIVNGKFQLERRELQQFFDVQFQGISKLLDDILKDLAGDGVERVKHILLSGGLGGSAYILDRLKDYVENSESAVLRGVQVHQSSLPRLAVIDGLLFEQDNRVLRTRAARASYGVLTNARYDADSHYGEDIVEGLDGHRQVPNQIVWVVRKGETFNNGHRFMTTVEKQIERDASLRLEETVVVSHGWGKVLPASMKKAALLDKTGSPLPQRLRLVVDLSDVADRKALVKKPKSRIFHKSELYLHCEYKLFIMIGPSGDVGFEAEHNGRIIPVPSEYVDLRV
ncbi:hypothetical protein QBC40DRAFT_271122 [Triangularia verruculosa]|uniref:Uncharacterized protein n=1 Tax=Triangularia verruculosa TaxID=2587418 RepID=A0AAN6XRF0_9PEZI|nr:hypothetical protein QBC40DRAFT_271122 [Triangularia verruculosa]